MKALPASRSARARDQNRRQSYARAHAAIRAMTLEAWANALGMLGTLGIAVPAIKAARIVRLVRRGELAQRTIPQEQTQLMGWITALNEDLRNAKDAWNIVDTSCLFGGLFLTFIAYLLSFLGQVLK